MSGASLHPALGLGIIALSGMLVASFPAPMRLSAKWRWENTWLVWATLALVLIPLGIAAWAVPHLTSVYASIPLRDFLLPLIFGFGWGIAQTTFGIAIARVGMAMAFAIVVGLSSLLGSFIPLAVFHPKALSGWPGIILMISAVLLACGLILYARAGRERDLEIVEPGSSSRTFLNGLLLGIFTGCFGSMINMGFVFGGGIAAEAIRRGVSAERATLSVWVIVLAAGYLPNCAYTIYLLKQNRSAKFFKKNSLAEALLALAAAVLWLFGMLGYGVGASVMGTYGNSIGFAVCMAVLLLWSSGLGILAGEWRHAPARARRNMHLGMALIIASTSLLGFGSLLY